MTMLTDHELTELLAREYEEGYGFFGKLRGLTFDKNAYERLINLLNRCELINRASVDMALVKLLWFIPTFVDWQRERVIEFGSISRYEYDRAADSIMNLLMEKVLGMP